jgi:putative SOS response-associated peptidase YedK
MATPTQQGQRVCCPGHSGSCAAAEGLKLDTLRWGVIPFWAKDAKIGYSMGRRKYVRHDKPYPAERIDAYRVSPAVADVKNGDPLAAEPIED